MGKLVGGPFGQMSGKTGDLVGGSWKGIATIKRYQPKVANPRTATQIAQRSKMAYCVKFAQAILASVIKPCWDRFQSQQSGFNAFVSRNIAIFDNDVPSDMTSLITSSGKMDATPVATITATKAQKNLTLTWLNDSGQGFKLATDKAFVVAVSTDNGYIKGFATNVARSAMSATITMDNDLTPDDVMYVYLTFLRADGTVVSNSSHISKTVAV